MKVDWLKGLMKSVGAGIAIYAATQNGWAAAGTFLMNLGSFLSNPAKPAAAQDTTNG